MFLYLLACAQLHYLKFLLHLNFSYLPISQKNKVGKTLCHLSTEYTQWIWFMTARCKITEHTLILYIILTQTALWDKQHSACARAPCTAPVASLHITEASQSCLYLHASNHRLCFTSWWARALAEIVTEFPASQCIIIKRINHITNRIYPLVKRKNKQYLINLLYFNYFSLHAFPISLLLHPLYTRI